VPKISVYVPDDLAERLRQAKLPVSAICQAALHEALRRAEESEAALISADPDLPADLQIDQPMVRHLVQAIRCAYLAAASRGSVEVDPSDLLRGMLDEGESLILKTIEAIGIDRRDLLVVLDERVPPGEPIDVAEVRLSDHSRAILATAAATARTDDGPLHLAHVLVALSDDGDNVAAEVMRQCRLDSVALRRSIAATQQGLLFAQVNAAGAPAELAATLAAIDERLVRIEQAVGGVSSPVP
jgi:ATP-dependent Clp protease ATP-binding subunit ClpC